MENNFLTKPVEFELPHPPIQKRMILFICKVIQRARQLLIEEPPVGFQISSAVENEITTELVIILENRLRHKGEIKGFNKKTYGMIHRDTKKVNFDKKHPDKMPDIFIDLQRDEKAIISDQDGLFVECKPVDKKHSISSIYCKDGLIRFVNGDYAWAMQNAMMIGYVKEGFSFADLATVLNTEGSSIYNTKHHEKNNDSIYQSQHRRDFEWIADLGKASDISVTHLWLQNQLPDAC
jgi:hypothetical protein